MLLSLHCHRRTLGGSCFYPFYPYTATDPHWEEVASIPSIPTLPQTHTGRKLPLSLLSLHCHRPTLGGSCLYPFYPYTATDPHWEEAASIPSIPTLPQTHTGRKLLLSLLSLHCHRPTLGGRCLYPFYPYTATDTHWEEAASIPSIPTLPQTHTGRKLPLSLLSLHCHRPTLGGSCLYPFYPYTATDPHWEEAASIPSMPTLPQTHTGRKLPLSLLSLHCHRPTLGGSCLYPFYPYTATDPHWEEAASIPSIPTLPQTHTGRKLPLSLLSLHCRRPTLGGSCLYPFYPYTVTDPHWEEVASIPTLPQTHTGRKLPLSLLSLHCHRPTLGGSCLYPFYPYTAADPHWEDAASIPSIPTLPQTHTGRKLLLSLLSLHCYRPTLGGSSDIVVIATRQFLLHLNPWKSNTQADQDKFTVFKVNRHS